MLVNWKEKNLNCEGSKNTISEDSDNYGCSVSVCANCKRQPQKGPALKHYSHCQITCYCSVESHRKEWDFQRFARSAVGKALCTKDV